MNYIKKLILGVDPGNDEGKTVGPFGAYSFKTYISESVDIKVNETFGTDDMSFEIDGRTGLAGTIAKYENEFGSSSMYGETKAHPYTKIRVLLSIYRYLKKYQLEVETVSIVIGQPFKTHTEIEKKALKEMLIDTHDIVVNGESMIISIGEVGVAPEGVAAFWGSNQSSDGTARTIDIGSGTINAIATTDFHIINGKSDTFNYGTETKAPEVVVRGIIQDTTAKGWKRDDHVLVCGGSAGVLTQKIKEHYINAEVMVPTLKIGELSKTLEPKFANAVGFYHLAKRTFK